MTKNQYLAAATELLAHEIKRTTIQLRSGIDSLAADIVNGRMSADSITRAEIDVLLDRFSASTSDSFEHHKAADAVIAALHRYKRFASDCPAEPQSTHEPSAKIPVAGMRSGPFHGMGIRDAAVEQIRRGGKQTPREIWAALNAGGFESAHQDPVHAVQNGLIKRARVQKDIFLVGEGKWDLCNNYPEDERAKIAEALGGQAGRDARLHRANTVEGMLLAQARGVKLGAKKMLTEEQSKQILEMARAGKTKEKIAKQFGISTASVTNYVKRLGYNNLYELRREGKELRTVAAGNPPSDTEPDGTRH